MSLENGSMQAGTRAGGFADYLRIARLDHSTKQIFIVPGLVIALLLRGVGSGSLWQQIVLGLLAALCGASANYCINEWLDRDHDRHHPTKSQRVAVQARLSGRLVLVEWLLLVGAALGAAALASTTMLVVVTAFVVQGIVYNVEPFRSKDKPFLDVISESVNNPLRLLIGWVMVDATTLPPSSVVLSYWLGGAFLMAAKRLSEYREICATHGRDLLIRYRRSFGGYGETSLTVSCFVYAMLSTFFLAVFLIKYRIEYLITMPLVVALFGHYLALAMRPQSAAQQPERLYRERGLMLIVVLLTLAFAVATFVDMPLLERLTSQQFMGIG